MIAPNSKSNFSQDTRLLAATLWRLAMPRMLTRIAVIAVVAAIWLWISNTLVRLGKTVRYDGFEAFGQQVVDFLVRINPYIWWGLVLILSLFVLGGLRKWMRHSLKHGKQTIVPLSVIQDLNQRLSPEVIDVLRWVWQDTEVPITVGDLQMTLHETRSGRVRKLALARAQLAALQSPGQSPAEPSLTTSTSDTPGSEPTL